MTINFPVTLDSNETLFEVHDSLQVRLTEDYNPGDTTIQIFGDEETIRRFPDTGIITLTEQCSEITERAISFSYTTRTLTSFEGLELIEGIDSVKPKRITYVTQNVMAQYHNILKDAVIAIELFVGRKGQIGLRPKDGTLEQRTNFIRKLALTPKAWFTVNKTIGLVPLTIEFKDLSFRLGTDGNSHVVKYIWDFGDNTDISVSEINATEEVPIIASNVIVNDLDGGTILKTYTTPGLYDVTLTVQNDFGEDTVILKNLINARIAAPDESVISFIRRANQIETEGSPDGGPYTIPPTLRSPVDTLIDIEIPTGTNSATGRSYAGEALGLSGSPVDPIAVYTWSIADDLTHNNSQNTRALFSIGGIYDLILRVDTEFGAYRVTTYENALDIVEKTNLWLWTISGNNIYSYEYGLNSETFKTKGTSPLNVGLNDSFLDNANNETQQKREFFKNNGFLQRGTTGSGNSGSGLLYWASGRDESDTPFSEKINIAEYNGFTDTYTAQDSISRPWNWVGLGNSTDLYFILGGITSDPTLNSSPTNMSKMQLELNTLSVTNSSFSNSNFKNGADELKQNVVTYTSGVSDQGNMSVYRSTWKENTGFILRNNSVGQFFKIKSFYKTSGTYTNLFQDIRKLDDMTGSSKIEGELTTLNDGLYFFNNSGSVSAYNDVSGIWAKGGPGLNSPAFRKLQDVSVLGFDDASNTLLAASDADSRAYISFDYTSASFIKYNNVDTTFTSLGVRPDGVQWKMAIY